MTGSQCLPAGRRAEALVLERKLGVHVSDAQPDTIVYTSLGDGTTSEGEVEEAIRDAVRNMAPLMFVDRRRRLGHLDPGGDQHARRQRQPACIASTTTSARTTTWKSLRWTRTDFVATLQAMDKAVTYLRSAKGPVLIHAHVTRPLSHSSADTQANYRQPEDLAQEEARDPLTRWSRLLRQYGIAADELQKLDALIKAEVRKLANDGDRGAAHRPRRPSSTT